MAIIYFNWIKIGKKLTYFLWIKKVDNTFQHLFCDMSMSHHDGAVIFEKKT